MLTITDGGSLARALRLPIDHLSYECPRSTDSRRGRKMKGRVRSMNNLTGKRMHS